MFAWNDQYILNIPLIDRQHEVLFEYVDKLYKAMDEKFMAAGTYRHQTKVVLEDLFSFTKLHFSDEEYLMTESDYPNYQEHKKVHEDFLHQIKDFYALYCDTSNSIYKIGLINCYLLNFFKKGISEHILEVDKKFTSFFIEQGCLKENRFLMNKSDSLNYDGYNSNAYAHILLTI